jgi:hypothetical protein
MPNVQLNTGTGRNTPELLNGPDDGKFNLMVISVGGVNA